MTKTIALVLSLTLFSACAHNRVIGGTEYEAYGIFNEDEKKNPDIAYEPSWGNVFWGIILIETIIAPIYFFGYRLFEPVGRKPVIKGAVPSSR